MEEKPLEKEKIEPKYIAKMFLEKIEPDKWYGTCYGKDLKKEFGEFYQ
jgi:hypothetical protein|tara:strand:+ start:1016 stop:1159 length:144 start_codon:yes stop_codon:yes gene_type:complete